MYAAGEIATIVIVTVAVLLIMVLVMSISALIFVKLKSDKRNSNIVQNLKSELK